MAGPEPTEVDVDLAIAAQRRLGETALGPATGDEPACATCRHFLDPSAAVAYCWHPVHRGLVDARWRCDHHAPDTDR